MRKVSLFLYGLFLFVHSLLLCLVLKLIQSSEKVNLIMQKGLVATLFAQLDQIFSCSDYFLKTKNQLTKSKQNEIKLT